MAARHLRRAAPEQSHATQLDDLPDAILSQIFSLVCDVRSRNAIALACGGWYKLERSTRSTFCLRANVRDLHFIPRCFTAVRFLDLSMCSPWGYSLFQPAPACILIGQLMKQAFPNVRCLVIYARSARDIDMAAYLWPRLESIKLIRWHPRATKPEEAAGLGMELRFLLQNCELLKGLDLSEFYCWPEDIPPALMAGPVVAHNLRSLNLLKITPEGFKATEVTAITLACRNLEDLRIICIFHPHFLDYVGDEALLAIARNCPKLLVLHLIDQSTFDDQDSSDSTISPGALKGLFQSLALLEDLAIVLSHNLRNAGAALEELSMHCKRLRSLKVGKFCDICSEPPTDGLASCSSLTELTIMKCADLTDAALAMIGRGCYRLQKLALCTCEKISALGLRACAQHLCSTLVHVEISGCLLLDAASILWALEPIRSSIQHLHIDGAWSNDIQKGKKTRLQVLCSEPGTSDVQTRSKDKLTEGQESVCKSSGSEFLDLGLSQSSFRACDDLDLGLSLGGASAHPNGLILGSPPSKCCKSDAFLDSFCTRDESSPSECRQIDSDAAISGYELGSASTCAGRGDPNRQQAGLDVLKANEVLNFACRNGSEGLSSASMQESFSIENDVLGLCCARHVSESKDSSGVRSNVHTSVDLGLGASEMQGTQNLLPETVMMKSSGNHQLKLFDFGLAAANPYGHIASSPLHTKPWSCLSSLSLWIPVGELIEQLPDMGLQYCPLLEEVTIKVQGDLRQCPKPSRRSCGISVLSSYPQLSKLVLDCSEAVGFALSAPVGHMDLSLWERWYLMGVESLNISTFDYWPPQDRDINQRGITLPSAGLISQCFNLRKLVIHGTAHEHFMLMLLRIPNLRDLQVRGDYYPAPQDELSTEMRTNSCQRIELALANHGFPD